MGKPDEGTVVVEPVENGWLVLCWEEPEDDEMECEDDDCPGAEEPEEPGYDPSASFAASLNHGQPTPEQAHQMVTHLHIHDHGLEPRRYVFENTKAMNEFVSAKNLAFTEKRETLRAALAARRAEKKTESED
jgi:hypothetical protein